MRVSVVLGGVFIGTIRDGATPPFGPIHTDIPANGLIAVDAAFAALDGGPVLDKLRTQSMVAATSGIGRLRPCADKIR